jgi:alpha/beta superfamily hydrolase
MDTVREIAGPVGILEVKLDLPAGDPRAVAVIAPPHPQYGGTLQTKAVYEAAQALVRIGVAVLRFNFRGTGSSTGTFDEGRGERDDYRAALDFAAGRFPGSPIWAVGMSFGAWVASDVGAADPRVALIVAIAPAVDHYDYSALASAGKPVFVVHGEEDAIAPMRQVRQLYGTLAEPKELVVIEGADHVFDGRTSIVGEAIEDLLGDF